MLIKIAKSTILRNMMNKISFSDEEIEAIRVYQSPGNDGKSGEINRALYNVKDYRSPEIDNYIAALTSACDKGIIEHEIEVLRGEFDFYGINDPKNYEYLEGKIFEKKGFLSTSISRPFSRPITYKIIVPKHTHAIYLRNIAYNELSGAFEDELLIQRGYKIQIDKIVRDGDGFTTVNSHLIIE